MMNDNNKIITNNDTPTLEDSDLRQSFYQLNDDTDEYLIEFNGSNNTYPWLLNKDNDVVPSSSDFSLDFHYITTTNSDGTTSTRVAADQKGEYKEFSIYDNNIGNKQQNFFHLSYDEIKLEYNEDISTTHITQQDESVDSVTWGPKNLNITFTILHCNNAKKNLLNFFRNNVTEAIGLNLSNNKPSFLKRKIKNDFINDKDLQHDTIKQERGLPSASKDVTAHRPIRISDYEYLDVYPVDYSYNETDDGAIEISVNFFIPKPAFYKKWALIATQESGVQRFNLPESPIDIEWLAQINTVDTFDPAVSNAADSSIHFGDLSLNYKTKLKSNDLKNAGGMPTNLPTNYTMRDSTFSGDSLGKSKKAFLSYNGNNKIQLNDIKTFYSKIEPGTNPSEIIKQISDNYNAIIRNLNFTTYFVDVDSLQYNPYLHYASHAIFEDDFHISAYLRDINWSLLKENANKYGFTYDDTFSFKLKPGHHLKLIVYLKQYNYL